MVKAPDKINLHHQHPSGQESLISKLVRRYKSSADTENEQATSRLALVSIGVLYLWLLAHLTLPIEGNGQSDVINIWTKWWWPSAYFLYALGHIVSLLAHPGRLFARRVAMVLFDNVAITVIVSYGGLFSPFVALYFWITIGYGFRFGPNWSIYSAGSSVACILFLLYLDPAWNTGSMNTGSIFGASLILSLCVASGYTYFLLQRLWLAQQNLVAKAGEMEKMATRDHLTGLANRALLTDRLTHAIALATRLERDVAVLFIDIDGLKKVNDEMGHAAGDALLIDVAKRLQTRLRAVDTCARIAGDEFVIILDGVADRHNVLSMANTVLEEICSVTSVANRPIKISASIGIAWLSSIPKQLWNPDALLAAADGAMYEAKRSGRNRYCVAGEALHQLA